MHEHDGTGSTKEGHPPARIVGQGEGSSLSTGPVQLEYKVTKEDDSGARFLAFWSPGGFERMFAEAADDLEKLGGAGPKAMARVMPPLWEKYGIATAQDGDADG